MPAAAAEAPTGSHQVLARKKYALINVISQTTIKITRPMYGDLPSWVPGPPHLRKMNKTPENRMSGDGTAGAYHRSLRVQERCCVILAPSRCTCDSNQTIAIRLGATRRTCVVEMRSADLH